jgi:DNA-binding transcriptional ArsR family regulator
MITLEFGPADLLRCRFAISPLWETAAAVRCLLYQRGRAAHLPWVRAQPPASSLKLSALRAMLPEHGYIPDFLTPPPSRRCPAIGDELNRVRTTPPGRAYAEMQRAAGPRASVPAIRRLLDDPAQAAIEFADTLQQCWDTLLSPHWSRIHDVLEGDIAYRSRRMTDGGTEALLADLHPTVRWADGRILIDSPSRDRRDLAGQGLLLMPSFFNSPAVSIYTDRPWQPTLIYPARGVATAWLGAHPPPTALAQLIGRTRASILGLLTEPTSTARIARKAGISSPTASAHLHALLATGLVARNRVGREVRYRRTSLGETLLGPTKPEILAADTESSDPAESLDVIATVRGGNWPE